MKRAISALTSLIVLLAGLMLGASSAAASTGTGSAGYLTVTAPDKLTYPSVGCMWVPVQVSVVELSDGSTPYTWHVDVYVTSGSHSEKATTTYTGAVTGRAVPVYVCASTLLGALTINANLYLSPTSTFPVDHVSLPLTLSKTTAVVRSATRLTAAAPSQARRNTYIVVTSKLTVGTKPVAGARIVVQFRKYGTTTWRTITAVKTSTLGTAKARVKHTASGSYRTTYAGSTKLKPATSLARYVRAT